MIPTRPIKTFKSWMLHNVEYVDPIDNWALKLKLRANGFFFGEGLSDNVDDIGEPGYLICWGSGHQNGIHHLYLGYKEDADRLIEFLGAGEYTLLEQSKTPLRNTAIFGNYTLTDMKATFGDPLPDKIQFLLADLKHRNIDYFSSFNFMHQDWGRKKWWPAAFIYSPRESDDDYRERMLFLKSIGCDFDNFDSHACGMYEFEHANHAMLFKLKFGEDLVPKR